MCLKLERIANLIQCNVRRGHSAAVYISGLKSTSVGHQNKIFRVSHTGTPVDTWGVSMCETCPKKVSIPALVRENIMSSAWNSAKTDNCDVHFVEERSPHFTSDSEQRLIQDVMWCSRDLDIIKQKTNEVEQKLKNMIDVLGRI
ncbi:hypothetical protein AB205_0171440 [Aquarana catesbeiana]|uniref:Uncharacterized protein n=1 Tax=Aquarana catesbeiana TaxID=8400 RepID=A0A2G9QGM6_AQUCT|nr:hypothetical protein AB205_0171440 [Aquarana catesbeiana]